MIKSTLLTQLLPGLPLPPYLDIYKFIFLFTFSILGVQFDSSIYSLISDLPIVWRNLPDGRTWRELVNSLPRATISISTQLMMELCLPSHHMLWVFLVWGCLCLMHVTITVSLHMQTPCWVQKKKKPQFPWSHLQSLNFTIFLLLLQQESLSLMGEEYHIAVPFMVGHSPIYYFFTSWPVESLCANCLLLQEEMSLMRVKRHTDQYTPQEGSTRSFVSISRNNSSSFSPRLPDISSHRSLALSIVKGMSSIS